MKHQASLKFWDETITRIRDKIKQKKLSLMERQTIDPEEHSKNLEALNRYI